MSNQGTNNTSIGVTGLSQDVTRDELKSVFGSFGKLKKIYIHPKCAFANIYFAQEREALKCLEELKANNFGWTLQNSDFHSSSFNQNNSNSNINNNQSWDSESEATSRSVNMDDNLEIEFVNDLVDVHGNPVKAFRLENGEFYVSLKDIRKTGFSVFSQGNFDKAMASAVQINQEFGLHLLTEARKFLLANSVQVMDEQSIIKTIENVKEILMRQVENGGPEPSLNGFANNQRKVSCLNNALTVTATDLTKAKPSENRRKLTQNADNFQLPVRSTPDKIFQSKAIPEKAQPSENTDKFYKVPEKLPSLLNKTLPLFKPPEKNQSVPEKTPETVRAVPEKTTEAVQAVPEKTAEPARKGLQSFLRKAKPTPEEIPRLKLDNKEYELVVSVPVSNHVYWMQMKTSLNLLADMFAEIQKDIDTIPEVTPEIGGLYLAEFEGIWFRSTVTSLQPKISVHFIDYGNIADVGCVKKLPDSLKTTPAQAFKINIKNYKGKKMDEDESITVLIEEMTDKDSYTASVKEPVVKKPTTFLNNTKPLRDVREGEKVQVLANNNGKLSVFTKDCMETLHAIKNHILGMEMTPVETIQENQLVLCCKDGLQGFFRAIVKKTDGKVINLNYIDYPGEENLILKALRNVDEFLATQPAAMLTIPLVKCLENSTEKTMQFMEKIIMDKVKLVVVQRDDICDLRLPDGMLLSKKVAELNEQPKPVAKTSDVVLYDEMDYVTPKMGLNKYVCCSFKDINDVTFFPVDKTELVTILSVIEDNDKTPYKPNEFEMCLAYYAEDNEEGSWYRGVVLKKLPNDKFDILFVDYGNNEILSCTEIRKYPLDLKEIPILGINCEFVGVTAKAEPRLKELIRVFDSAVTLDFKEAMELKYKIEAPDAYKQLASEGLL